MELDEAHRILRNIPQGDLMVSAVTAIAEHEARQATAAYLRYHHSTARVVPLSDPLTQAHAEIDRLHGDIQHLKHIIGDWWADPDNPPPDAVSVAREVRPGLFL